ncbi:Rasrelated GTPase [Acanthamoeba castellanii str. Neff]|jgi:Ras family protein|uniref:Rasrelated GTPase n=1 Tax=Acanthamoeba castellanii (strain ATCC 30010 / Neff) TaxID=1257118 RepID=L8HHY1_ACACF|nr:Rasrelated GTPase [Acanthamoeba castellanii str. Neff]ELR24800.1 Rasrelated GTPase [Acanthamoeba castellanii str. Neff]
MPLKKSRKIAVVGFRAVGKSAVTIQFSENHFAEAYNPTIENTFHKTLKHKGTEYELEIIDTAGQDEQSIMPFRGTIGIDGYVMVYSVASRTSMETVKVLNEKIINESGTATVPRVLVGNKSDLHNDRSISVEEGKRTAEELNCAFIECSAKHNENISQVFITILEEIEKLTAPQEPVQESKCILC